MINYIWWQTILHNFIEICSAVAEELRPQDVPIRNNVKNEQSPITPIKIVESKWQFSMIIRKRRDMGKYDEYK